jgi:hypothetical protein
MRISQKALLTPIVLLNIYSGLVPGSRKKKIKKILIVMAFSISYFLNGLNGYSQEQPVSHAGPSEDEIKKANDPMADAKAINLQNYYVSSIDGVEHATLNQFLVRYSQPVGRVLIRASMPFVVSSLPSSEPVTGLGDFNMFAIYSFSPTPGNKFGIGSLIVAPTGTKDLGQGKWQTGISALAFFAKNRLLQFGSLLQWQISFAGDDDRKDVSLLTPQMFFIWQIGGGTYVRSTGVWSFDLYSGNYNVPLGIGIGKVIKVGKVVFNIFAEPQFSVFGVGIGQPKVQTFFGFNSQF